MRSRSFQSAYVLAAVLAVGIPARATESSSTEAETPPVAIHVPRHAVSPELAAVVSGLTLLVGITAGTILLTRTTQGVRPQIPGFAVIASTLVLAPGLGRWIGGDVKTATARTGVRLLIAGVASLAAYYGFDETGGGPRPLGIAAFGLLAPVVLAHAISDIAATSRDLRLDRAVEALTISRTARGAPVLNLAARF